MKNGQNLTLFSKTALITGASRGLGKAITLAFASVGARVVMVSRDLDALRELAGQIRTAGREAWPLAFDLSQIEQIPDFFDRVVGQVGCVDVLVNVAGVITRGAAVNYPIEDWERVLRLNLTVPFVLSQCFAKQCIQAQRPGKIINVASLLSEGARPSIPAYTAAKGGIKQLTKALAVEWAPHRITVNAIGPGYFKTEMTRPLYEDEKFNRWVEERTPMRRWGSPEELGGAAVFLASDAADFITGQVLYVDGGWLANL